jgi:hypothetical protein
MRSFIVSTTCHYYQGDEEEDEDEMGGVYRRNGRENPMRVHFVHVGGKAH